MAMQSGENEAPLANRMGVIDVVEARPPAATHSDAASGSGPSASLTLAGLETVLEVLREVIGWPLVYRKQAEALGVRWPRGVLLHGPPGTGKSAAVAAVAREFGAVVHQVTAASIFGAYTGQSERRLREVFAAAEKDAAAGHASVVFLDEVDALCPRREAGRQHEARVVGQLLTLMDGARSGAQHAQQRLSTSSAGGTRPSAGAAPDFVPPPAGEHGTARGTASAGRPPSAAENASASANGGGGRPTAAAAGGACAAAWGSPKGPPPGHLVVVAATSRPNAVDPALRRAGRLDREVEVAVPDAQARGAILRLLAARMPLAADVDLDRVAERCHGYTGADLAALCREAAMGAVAAYTEAAEAARERGGGAAASGSASGGGQAGEGDAGGVDVEAPPPVAAANFEAAMALVGPSVARGAAKRFPPASWDDVGGLESVKTRLRQAVEWPMAHAGAFKRMGLKPPRGVLLHGPPGCAKTTLARAAATASGATFFPLSGAELYSMYVGEGEASLREAFRRARMAAPAIVFVDELDTLVGKRGAGGTAAAGGRNEPSARILSTLLTEMDGLELAKGVLVLATTNRPHAIDTALLRPGRFDVALYVPPPDEPGRLAALRVHTRAMPLAADVELSSLAQRTQRYTGAELAAVCREAALAAVREDEEGATEVAARHFEAAVGGVRAALSDEELARYESWPPRRGAAGRQPE